MNDADASVAERIDPVFEGFFLQMVLPDMDQQAEQACLENLGEGWKIKHIGDALTQFEVSQPKEGMGAAGSVSIKEIWDRTYRLRIAPGVVDADPLFGVPLPERPIRKVGEFSVESTAAFSLNADLPESDDADWGIAADSPECTGDLRRGCKGMNI